MLTFTRTAERTLKICGPRPEAVGFGKALRDVAGAAVDFWPDDSGNTVVALFPPGSALLTLLAQVGESWNSGGFADEIAREDEAAWQDHRDEQEERRAAARGVL